MEALDKKIIRYAIIDRYLKKEDYPRLTKIHKHLEKKMGREYCRMQVQIDINNMIKHFDAPIEYDHMGWGYTEPYRFWKKVFLKISDHIELPTDINKIIFK